jgi:hypothetical protein
MGRKALTYLAMLIGLEIVVYRATNAGSLLTKGGSAAGSVIKSIEGPR